MHKNLKNARRAARWLYAQFLAISGCLWWAKRQLRDEGAVVGLMFHRVLGEPSYQETNCQPEIIIREQTFKELVAHVARHYEAVDLAATTPGGSGSKPKVAFTFDDGWQDNYSVALSIASQYEIPYIVFVCSELVGKQMPFWPEKVVALLRAMKPRIEEAHISESIEELKKCPPEELRRKLMELFDKANKEGVSEVSSNTDATLSWSEIAEMDRRGVRFGSHTRTHQILTVVEPETARQEVLGSKASLEKALGKSCEVFSYPNGNWSPDVRRMVQEAGYRKAVATEHGAWTTTTDPLCIPRINVQESTVVGPSGRFSPAVFEFATFWKAWRATRAVSRQGVVAESESRPSHGLDRVSQDL